MTARNPKLNNTAVLIFQGHFPLSIQTTGENFKKSSLTKSIIVLNASKKTVNQPFCSLLFFVLVCLAGLSTIDKNDDHSCMVAKVMSLCAPDVLSRTSYAYVHTIFPNFFLFKWWINCEYL